MPDTPNATETGKTSPCCVCGQTLSAEQANCPACGASGAWQDLLAAVDFAHGCFARWAADRMIGAGPWQAIGDDDARRREGYVEMAKEGRMPPADAMLIPVDRCWNCQTVSVASEKHCVGCGVPLSGAMAQSLRYWTFTCHRIKAQCDAGRLPLVQAHACMSQAKSQIAALRTGLEKDRVAMAEVVKDGVAQQAKIEGDSPIFVGRKSGQSPAANSEGHDSNFIGRKLGQSPAVPRKPLWEILLDPRSIQWFLGLGGALFVLGLVIWLAAEGVFDNPVVVAVSLGVANVAVLLGGWATIRFSRYQTAGRAITLLACLVMPLNLWFYHANNLITIGGNLWGAALVCCVLYLASALVLRDHLFVYVFTGGIAMTGLLMLADAMMFWEIASPAALLVGLGLIFIHAERAFPEIEGPFSHRRFGMAFFQSGHALLAAGLLLVFGAQLAGDWLYDSVFARFYQQWKLDPPIIVTEQWGQLLALGLILAGTYAYFYSDIVVRRIGLYVYLAVFTLLWAEMDVIRLVAENVAAEAAIIALALTALAANLAQPKLLAWQRQKINSSDGSPVGGTATALSLVRAGQPLGLFLSTVPVLLGFILHLRATYQPVGALGHLAGGVHPITWLYVAAMFATAVSCRVGAHLYRHAVPWLSATYFFGTAAATLMGVSGLLVLFGIQAWDELAPLVMIVPILYIIASRVYRGHTQEKPVALVAHAATAVMIVSVLAAAVRLTPTHVFDPVTGKSFNLLMAAFFAETALFYALAAAFRRQGFNVYLGTAAACGAVWQLLFYWEFHAESYTLIFALLGLVLLVCYRLAVLEWTGLARPAFQCANALMSLSLVAAALMTLSRLASHRAGIEGSLVLLLIGLTAMSLLAAWLVRDAAGRRWYYLMAIAEAGLTFVTIQVISQLTLWQKLEIFCVVAGAALLAIGHVGWHRERERGQSDLVSFSLLCGSLLVGLPLTIAVLVNRCQPTPLFSTLNELGMLVAGILLLATGFVFQLRATTITGATLLLVYLISLVMFINMLENIQTAAFWVAIIGGVIFGTGILLSVYRDRLLTLPERVKRREGIFRVLGWR